MKAVNRREFLTTAAAIAAAGPFVSTSAKAAPGERVRIAFIGCGGRARQLMPMFKSFADVEVVAVSDVIEPRMDQALEIFAKGEHAQKPERVVDYRRILDRNNVDAVVIATTQHWHGLPHIHACQA